MSNEKSFFFHSFNSHLHVLPLKDEETSSQSSHISSSILPNDTNTHLIPIEPEHPTEIEVFPITEIKHDDFEICRCSEVGICSYSRWSMFII